MSGRHTQHPLQLDQGITGDTLPYLNPSSIADIGISSIGHRLAILKAIYQLKMDMTRAATMNGLGDQRPGEGMDEDEPLDNAHLDHRDGDMEEEPSLGWEWTEDDWRPAGMTRKSEVFQPRIKLNLPWFR